MEQLADRQGFSSSRLDTTQHHVSHVVDHGVFIGAPATVDPRHPDSPSINLVTQHHTIAGSGQHFPMTDQESGGAPRSALQQAGGIKATDASPKAVSALETSTLQISAER